MKVVDDRTNKKDKNKNQLGNIINDQKYTKLHNIVTKKYNINKII